MLHVLLAIVHKELLDGVRDRRAVLSAFSFPLFAPLLIAFMLNSLATRTDDPLELAIIGSDNAPELVRFLENQGVELQEAPEDPELAIEDGVLDVVLVIPEEYGEDFREGRPARVQMMVAIGAIPLETLGFRIVLTAEVGFWIFLIAAPLAPLAGALQLLIASFTRSFKEAQLYISLSLTLPMMPGLIMSLKPVKTEAWMYTVPLLSQQVLGAKLLRGESIAALEYLLAAGSTLALTAVCLWATVWLFSRERMLFGKG